MSAREEVLEANERYASSFRLADLAVAPARRIAAVVCMDARLMPDRFMGLEAGDAHIIRNAGGIVTDDVLRSLIVSHHMQGTQEFFVINHTDCGMMNVTDQVIRTRVKDAVEADPDSLGFHTFSDVEENVRAQVGRIRSSPYLSPTIRVHGFVYQVEDGRLREVA